MFYHAARRPTTKGSGQTLAGLSTIAPSRTVSRRPTPLTDLPPEHGSAPAWPEHDGDDAAAPEVPQPELVSWESVAGDPPVKSPGPPGLLEPPHTPGPPRTLNTRPRLVLFLFVATCLSTTYAGSFLANLTQGMTNSQIIWTMIGSGLQFTAAVMAILIAHEMGHYLQARRYGVPATLPFFIPMPISPFGTMGAVILQSARSADRKVLFDIAVSGPLAGLVLTIPITIWGLQSVEIIELPENPSFPIMVYGDPLMLQWMIEWVHGPLGENETVNLNPLVFAGWVGIFITALNLLPIGQLDGGHILYTLIGRRAHLVAFGLIFAIAGYMIYTSDPAFSVLLVLLVLMGPRHPPTSDDLMPLGTGRHLLGWFTLAFLGVGLTLNPIDIIEPAPKDPAPATAPDSPPPPASPPNGSS